MVTIMKSSTCETMRRFVLAAVTLLISGILVLLIGKGVAFVFPGISSLAISYLGLMLLLSSPLLMFFIFIKSLLPGSYQKFEQCNH